MANNNGEIKTYAPIRVMTEEGKAVYAEQVFDETRRQFQSAINAVVLGGFVQRTMLASELTSGKGIVASTGVATNNGTYGYSDFLPIAASSTIELKTYIANTFGVAFYSADNEDSYISGVVNTTGTNSITVPANAKYFRWSNVVSTSVLDPTDFYAKWYTVSGSLIDRVETLESDSSSLKSRMTSAEGDINALSSNVNNLATSVGALEAELAGFYPVTVELNNVNLASGTIIANDYSRGHYLYHVTDKPIKFKAKNGMQLSANGNNDGTLVATVNVSGGWQTEFTYNGNYQYLVFLVKNTNGTNVSSTDIIGALLVENTDSISSRLEQLNDEVESLSDSVEDISDRVGDIESYLIEETSYDIELYNVNLANGEIKTYDKTRGHLLFHITDTPMKFKAKEGFELYANGNNDGTLVATVNVSGGWQTEFTYTGAYEYLVFLVKKTAGGNVEGNDLKDAIIVENTDSLPVRVTHIEEELANVHSSTLSNAILCNNKLPENKAEIKILCIGNSFTDDMTAYIADVLSNLGITNFSIGVCNQGGQTIYNQWQSITGATSNFTFTWKVQAANTTCTLTNTSNTNLKTIIPLEDWDIVTFNQARLDYRGADFFEANVKQYFEQYIALIRLYCKASVAIAYQNTWAFAEDFATEYSGVYPYYGGLSYNTQDNIAYWQYVGGTQALQWANHCKEFCKIMAAYGINIIIPTGQAMQNIRTASFNNAHWNFTRDTLHCDYGIGRTLAAYTFYEAIIAPIVGKDIDECTYKPSVSTHVPTKTDDNWDDYSCVAVDNDKLALIKKAVKLACGNRSLTFNIESV